MARRVWRTGSVPGCRNGGSRAAGFVRRCLTRSGLAASVVFLSVIVACQFVELVEQFREPVPGDHGLAVRLWDTGLDGAGLAA